MLAGMLLLQCKGRQPYVPKTHVGYFVLMLPYGRYEETTAIEPISVGSTLLLFLEDQPYWYQIYRFEEDAASLGRFVGSPGTILYAWARRLR